MAEAEDELRQAQRDGLRLLSRREYSAVELQQKLRAKGYNEDMVEAVLTSLQEQNLQSDARFTEAYIRYRQSKGFGPLRIGQELKQKGVPQDLIDCSLNQCETPWEAVMAQARRKRFGAALPDDAQERARQSRFLQYRGFSPEQVHYLLSGKALDFA